MSYEHGQVPSDGFLGSAVTSGYRFRPNLKDGQRLSGVVTISPVPGTPAAVSYRMLVDGIPQPSNTIDTRNWSDGTHVVAFQVMDPAGLTVHNGSRVVVFNNSGQPFTDLEGQAIVGDSWGGVPPNSLAWGRIDVLPQTPYPLDPQLDKHPVAQNDIDRQRLTTEKIWWVEGLNHAPTPLWQSMPMVMKNVDGDYFIKHFNPQGGGSGVTPENARPYVEQGPAYDGPRGVGTLSPYATMNPYLHRKLASGQYGWIAVEKSGRVVTVDITGEIRTVLGPRSVAGVPGTDCDEMTVTLADRLANGEKEYVGDANGQMLALPHDVWPCSSFPFEGIIADFANNQVTEIHFEEQRLMRRWPLPGVTSVWDSYECQQSTEINIIWFAVNPEGLWCQRHMTAAPGTNPHFSGGSDGTFIEHVPTLEKLADIPKAFWVRGFGHRVFVFTTDLGIYEYNALTGEVTERLARRLKDETYVFAAVDETGSIGPTNRIYWGSASQKNGGYGSSKTTLFWLDPYTWEQGSITKGKLHNWTVYGNWTALVDPLGHYAWGIAIHPSLPKFLAAGITSSGWFLWTGCLGELPAKDPAIPYDGTKQYRFGQMDKYLGLAPVFGYHGHGAIGYSCDQWRDLQTYAEAQPVMRAELDPLFHPDMSEADREAVCKQMFAQRTRKHFQDGVAIPVPGDPIPDPPPPPPPPEPDPLTISNVCVQGGVPPYTVTITDSAGTTVTLEIE